MNQSAAFTLHQNAALLARYLLPSCAGQKQSLVLPSLADMVSKA